jgi:hypothetical protein
VCQSRGIFYECIEMQLTRFFAWILLWNLSIVLTCAQNDDVLTCSDNFVAHSKVDAHPTETHTTSNSRVLGSAQEDRGFVDATYMKRKQEEFMQRESVILYLEELESRHAIEQSREIKSLQDESVRLSMEQGLLRKTAALPIVEDILLQVDPELSAEEQLIAMQAEVDAIALAYSQAESEKVPRTLRPI